jgi:hypothetical protein
MSEQEEFHFNGQTFRAVHGVLTHWASGHPLEDGTESLDPSSAAVVSTDGTFQVSLVRTAQDAGGHAYIGTSFTVRPRGTGPEGAMTVLVSPNLVEWLHAVTGTILTVMQTSMTGVLDQLPWKEMDMPIEMTAGELVTDNDGYDTEDDDDDDDLG